MKLEGWFPTPIWHTFFEDITEEQYNVALRYCIDRSQTEKGVVFSNIGGWQSEAFYNKEDFIKTPLQPFLSQIDNNIKKAFADLDITGNKHITAAWINVNYTSNYNIPHVHPQSSLSGVFYLTDNNAKITFKRGPDVGSYHLEWLGSGGRTALSYQGVDYIPVKGQLLIFPSWLSHYVEASISKEPRVSVAFNCSY